MDLWPKFYDVIPLLISTGITLSSRGLEGAVDRAAKELVGMFGHNIDLTPTQAAKVTQNMKHLALDWASRLTFLSAMFVSFGTTIIAFGRDEEYSRLAILIVVIIMVCIYPFILVYAAMPGQYVVTRDRFKNRFTAAEICDGAVVLVNLILASAILIG